MAITDYSSLKTAISTWLNRDDLSTAADDFIDLAEAHFNRELRLKAQETALSVAISSGVAAVPSDYAELKHAYISSAPTRTLEIISPQDLYRRYPTRSSESKPCVIARSGDNFEFGPYPDSDYTLQGVYYAKWTALDDDNPTNWLITHAPDLYLWRSLMSAEGFVGNDPRMSIWAGLAVNAEQALKRQERRERMPAGMAPQTRVA